MSCFVYIFIPLVDLQRRIKMLFLVNLDIIIRFWPSSAQLETISRDGQVEQISAI